MAWIYLFVAGLLEVVWATGLKASLGFTRLLPSAVTLVAMAASIGFLAQAMRSLPLGTAYAAWTGIGTIGAFLVGIVVLHEPASMLRVLAAGCILAGLLLMKASG